MISVSKAKELIREHCEALPPERVALLAAGGLILAEDVYADKNFPAFRQSSMDGYAFLYHDWNNEPLLLAGEMQAGSTQTLSVSNKEAVRIFTGAPLPEGTDTVVMQEKVLVENKNIIIRDEKLQQGGNVRAIGSEITAGSLALGKGTLLTPGAIGFLAGLGKSEIAVIKSPKVAIIVTGKELKKPGTELEVGQVYESNSYALTSALKQLNIAVTSEWADDDLEVLTEIIQNSLQDNDLVLLTGGVSVGEYDFVSQALEANDVEKIFHKIKQKPGKPLLFGKKQNAIVFGLPGNPSSVLTCFYEYVLIALQQLMALPKPFIKTTQLPISNNYTKAIGLTHFLKGQLREAEVAILNAQESYKMNSFATANCLVVLEENKSEYKKGELCEVHFFPL